MRPHETCRRYQMKYRAVLFGVLLALVAVAPAPILGQAPPVAAGDWTQPRTAWGDPDLQGLWRSLHRVPFERPPQYEGREFLTDAEVAEQVRRGEQRNVLRLAGKQADACLYGYRPDPNYNSALGYSAEPIRVSKRTSAIIDPPTGRLPAWTPEQVERYEAREAATLGRGETDWTVDRPAQERCLPIIRIAALGFWGMALGGQSFRAPGAADTLNLGAGLSGPGGIGAKRILQAPGYVVITHEEQGDYEMIRLDGPALAPKYRQWLGDGRGHWEGTTLVVETANIKYPYPTIPNYGLVYPGNGETLRLTERFTLLGPDTIEYRYTIDDPAVYTQPYTVLHELTRDEQYKVSVPICREGHDAMPSLLAGARADEETALENAAETRRLREPRLTELKKDAVRAAEHAKTARPR